MNLMLALWTEISLTDCVLEKDFLSNMSEHRSYSHYVQNGKLIYREKDRSNKRIPAK